MGIDLEHLLQSAGRLASLPDLFHRIDHAVENPASSLDDIGAIIMEDPGLAARLLKIANSPFFGFPHPVETITRALTVVGTSQLRDLVMATTVINQFKDVPSELFDVSDFWRHSIACGLAARIIVTYRREVNVEAFYVAGLLHDIGRLILLQTTPVLAARIIDRCAKTRSLSHIVEQQALGFTHAQVGGIILSRWKLPERLCQPVTWHHDPDGCELYPLEAAVVHVADIIAQAMQLGSSGEVLVPPLSPGAWDRLELEANLLPAILRQVDIQYRDAVKAFLV